MALPVHLALPGSHNVANALAAAAIALEAGLAPGRGVGSGRRRDPQPHRMDVRLLDGDLLLVDDSYNANIDSDDRGPGSAACARRTSTAGRPGHRDARAGTHGRQGPRARR